MCVCMGEGRLHSSQTYVYHGKTNTRVCISGRYIDRQAGWQTEPNRCVDRLTYELESFSQVH